MPIEEFMPHGICFAWNSALIWTHTLSDLVIALTYFAIPVLMFRFLAKKPNIENKNLLIWFAAFILTCGLTHVVSIVTIWIPIYEIQAGLKAVTAVVSFATLMVIVPQIPQLLARPTHKELSDLNQRLFDSNRLNQQILNSIQQGIVVYNEKGEIQLWNRFMETTTGISKETCLGHVADVIAPFLKETDFWAILERGLKGEVIKQDPYFWNIPETGCSGWFSNVQVPLHQLDGKIIGVLKSVNDITEIKRAEASEQLATMVFDNCSEGMVVTDADINIIAVNPAFTKLTGYKPEDVLGKTPSILKSGRHDKKFYETMWRKIKATGHWEGEIWNRRKDGEIYAEWLTINSIYKDDGSVRRRVALFSDITSRKQNEELIWKQANFDSLTGLPNRRMFRDRLEHAIKNSSRTGHYLALMFIDLDHFKEVNDGLGHEIGDQLLKDAAERLVSCVRETDTVARLGGDEFTIILGEMTSDYNIDHVAQNVLRKIAQPFHINGNIAHISASIGTTIYPNDADTAAEMLINADQAMYYSKENGRNCASYFDAAIKLAMEHKMRLGADLRNAVAGDQFNVLYQPIIDMETGQIVKAEALVRWHHPERGLIQPVDFIPLAEEIGAILEIGAWVLRTACRQTIAWRENGLPHFKIAVNVSARQFQQLNFPEIVREALLETGLPADDLELEITEGMLMSDIGHAVDSIKVLREIGVHISEDDFGTGYSSLSYLKQFPIHTLKIDQSFIRDMASDPNDAALVSAIVAMANSLGMAVVAEGVETQEQLTMLRDKGCQQCQGFLFSKPLSVNDFASYLVTHKKRA